MNIDFHYGVTYVICRLAGLDKQQAQVVAHASQYVDDATTKGLLTFEGGETFERFASAHVMMDFHNAIDVENRVVWVPFHFLPGGEGETLDEKAVCKPDSPIAREMVRRAIERQGAENALHRLGVTLHTYIDTWAHQGFSGIVSDNNRLTYLEGDDHDHDTWKDALKSCVVKAGQVICANTASTVSGLGHGAALHFPDMPWANWSYTNAKNAKFVRNNLPEFIDAMDMACKVVQGFIHKNKNFTSEPGLAQDTQQALRDVVSNNCDHDPEARLKVFMAAVAEGQIPGLQEVIPTYIAKGEGSWKHKATGITDVADGDEKPRWTASFEDSDYRKFHDAIKEHRFVVTQKILPSFNIRLA